MRPNTETRRRIRGGTRTLRRRTLHIEKEKRGRQNSGAGALSRHDQLAQEVSSRQPTSQGGPEALMKDSTGKHRSPVHQTCSVIFLGCSCKSQCLGTRTRSTARSTSACIPQTSTGRSRRGEDAPCSHYGRGIYWPSNTLHQTEVRRKRAQGGHQTKQLRRKLNPTHGALEGRQPARVPPDVRSPKRRATIETEGPRTYNKEGVQR